jgi:hypothetical protein
MGPSTKRYVNNAKSLTTIFGVQTREDISINPHQTLTILVRNNYFYYRTLTIHLGLMGPTFPCGVEGPDITKWEGSGGGGKGKFPYHVKLHCGCVEWYQANPHHTELGVAAPM